MHGLGGMGGRRETTTYNNTRGSRTESQTISENSSNSSEKRRRGDALRQHQPQSHSHHRQHQHMFPSPATMPMPDLYNNCAIGIVVVRLFNASGLSSRSAYRGRDISDSSKASSSSSSHSSTSKGEGEGEGVVEAVLEKEKVRGNTKGNKGDEILKAVTSNVTSVLEDGLDVLGLNINAQLDSIYVKLDLNNDAETARLVLCGSCIIYIYIYTLICIYIYTLICIQQAL